MHAGINAITTIPRPSRVFTGIKPFLTGGDKTKTQTEPNLNIHLEMNVKFNSLLRLIENRLSVCREMN